MEFEKYDLSIQEKKIYDFRENKDLFKPAVKKNNKIKYLRYVITPKGIAKRTKFTINFMKKKLKSMTS